MLSHWETIPFHFVWVSLTLVYGIRLWRLRTTMFLLLVVMAVTGAALAWTIARGHESPDELAEVPLMAAMFLAMVWHAERRRAATEETGRLAESEHRLLMGQREFVRDASHELRTPITVARGHAELIRDSGLNGQVSKDAEVILDELGHLSSLSERLLILTTAGHPGFLSMTSVEVVPFIEGLVRRWTPTAARDWQVRIAAQGAFRADPERLGDRSRRGARERREGDRRRRHDPGRLSGGRRRPRDRGHGPGKGDRRRGPPPDLRSFHDVEADRAEEQRRHRAGPLHHEGHRGGARWLDRGPERAGTGTTFRIRLRDPGPRFGRSRRVSPEV